LNINQVIGKRLGLAVGRAKRDREKFMNKMKWRSQTYYEARSGRRVFRVGDLVAMANATGVPAWKFLDATGISKTVSVDGSKATVTSAALLDLFGSPAEGPSWHALVSVRETLGDLNSAVLQARRAEKVLQAVHPGLPAYEWEGQK